MGYESHSTDGYIRSFRKQESFKWAKMERRSKLSWTRTRARVWEARKRTLSLSSLISFERFPETLIINWKKRVRRGRELVCKGPKEREKEKSFRVISFCWWKKERVERTWTSLGNIRLTFLSSLSISMFDNIFWSLNKENSTTRGNVEGRSLRFFFKSSMSFSVVRAAPSLVYEAIYEIEIRKINCEREIQEGLQVKGMNTKKWRENKVS